MEIEVKHLRFKHPFTSVVVGPTNSGKTFYSEFVEKSFFSYKQYWFIYKSTLVLWGLSIII